MDIRRFASESQIIEGQFFSIYLTLIALIQSISLAFAAQIIIANFEPQFVLRYLLVLLMILCIWHHYTYGFLYMKWFPKFSDSVLPLLLGFSEIVTVNLLDPNTQFGKFLADKGVVNDAAWLLAVGITAFLGVLAYGHTALNIDPHLFTARMRLQDAEAHCTAIKRQYRYIIGSCLGQALLAEAGAVAVLFKGRLPGFNYFIAIACLWLGLHIYMYECLSRKFKKTFITGLRDHLPEVR